MASKKIAELPMVVVASKKQLWAITPTFALDTNSPSGKVVCTALISHGHLGRMFRSENGSFNYQEEQWYGTIETRTIPSTPRHGWAGDDGSNRQYDCCNCGTTAPLFVVQEKQLTEHRYQGYDPRNRRRAAVLATKEKRRSK